jgi:pentatricopeptide repeat protein
VYTHDALLVCTPHICTHVYTAYNALINSCAAVGDVDRAMRVLGQMYDDGLLPDAITYTSLIKTAAAANDADKAEEVCVQFTQLQHSTTSNA